MMREQDSNPLDEELAAITDEILAGRTVPKPSEDNDLNLLIETVVRLKNTFSDSEEEAIAKENIRKAWQKDWQKIESVKNTNTKMKLHSHPIFYWLSQHKSQFAITVAVLLLLVVAAPFLIGTSPELSGSAGAILSSKFSILIVVFLFVVILIWGLKRK